MLNTMSPGVSGNKGRVEFGRCFNQMEEKPDTEPTPKERVLTAVTLFALKETSKPNQVNPRVYFKQLVTDLHE